MQTDKLEILLIEGSPSEADLIQEMLSEAGRFEFSLQHVQYLAEGLRLLQGKNFDVILVDLVLPYSQGLENALTIRRQAQRTPVVALTVLDDEATALKLLSMDIQDYLIKGEITGPLLSRAIRHAIQRKRDSELLRENADRFKSFMLHLSAAAWIKDLGGKYIYANAEAERIFSTPLSVLQGKTDEEVFPPETAREFRKNDERVFAEGGSLQTTEVLVQAGGIEHHSIVSKFAVPDPDGKPAYVAGIAFDITDLIRAEEALRESQEKFSKIFDTVPVGITISTLDDGRFVDINEEGERLSGYRRDEVIGRTALEFNIWKDPAERARMIEEILKKGVVHNREMALLDKKGTVLRGLFSAVVIEIRGKKHLLSMVSDITERKRLEDDRERLLAEFEAVLYSLNEGVVICDLEGNILTINPAALALYGFERVEDFPRLRPQYQEVFDLFDLDGRPVPFDEWPVVRVCHGERFTDYELHVQRKDTGKSLLFSYSGTPVRTKPGNLILSVITLHDITERRRMEEAIRKSERKFSKIFHAVPALLGICTLEEGRFIDVNESALESLGYKREEVIGKTALELGLWEDESVRAKVMQTMEGQESIRNLEIRFRGKSGQALVGLYSGELVDLDGDRYLLSLVKDITERKKAEESIRASEAKFRTIFDSVNDAIFIHDVKSGAIIDVNQRMCELYGMTRTKALHATVGELSSNIPPYRQEDAATWFKKAAEGKPQLFEWHARHKDGTLFWVEVSMRRSSVGTTDCIIVTVRDITERKQTEEALANSERFLKAIVDTEPECIKLIDSECNLLMMNQAGLELIEADSFEQVKGQCICTLVTPPDRDAFVALTKQVFEGTPGTLEFELVGLKGRHIWLDTHAVPFRNENGEIVSLLGITRDITERKRADEERLNLEKQILHAQKLESLGVLAGGIAHDFNNILMAIIGNTDLAMARLGKDSPAVDNLRRIMAASKRAADLTQQMLAYSGKGRFVVEIVDLNRLLESMLHLLEVSISKNAILKLDLHRPLPPMEADATQVSQIVLNLVINASEAIGDANGVITITTGCRDCDRNYLKDVWQDENISEGFYVYLEIADTGCGMDKETVAKLFDPFFTTKFTGRGLGMAAVLGIIKGHKGSIKVYTEKGKGTTFKIILPASKRAAGLLNQDNHDMQDNCDRHTGGGQGRGKVLLVDDEEAVRGIGAEMLQELGFTPIMANDGEEAIRIFKETPDIAFVILDLTMPCMDGVQCFRELRQLAPKIKVIMSSGYNEQDIVGRIEGKGLSGFIQKPYNLSALKDLIKMVE